MNRSSFWLRFDVWFIVTTIIYVVLFLARTGKVAFAVGLFVPLGPLNFPFIILPSIIGTGMSDVGTIALNWAERLPGIGAFLLCIAFLLFGEKILKRFNLKPAVKITVNLIILFLLTLSVDLLTMHSWVSLSLLLQQ